MRNNIVGARIFDCVMGNNRVLTSVQTLAGTFTITSDMPGTLVLNNGGAARTVLLPAPKEGLQYQIFNSGGGAFNLSVEYPLATVIVAIPQNQVAVCQVLGGVWKGFLNATVAMADPEMARSGEGEGPQRPSQPEYGLGASQPRRDGMLNSNDVKGETADDKDEKSKVEPPKRK